VDVTISKDDRLTIVECRLHSRTQDVQWVEELHGRRQSLGAQGVIGVSASGFSEGAILKARALGVVLREFRRVTADEVTRWGRLARLSFPYARFERLKLVLVVDSGLIVPVPPMPSAFRTESGEPWPLGNLISDAARKLFDENAPEGWDIRLPFFTKDLRVSGLKVEELFLCCRWRRLRIEHLLSAVVAYGDPAEDAFCGATIQAPRVTETRLISHAKTAALILDLSIAAPIPNAWPIKQFDLDLGEPLAIQSFCLIGEHEPQVTMVPMEISFVRRDSDAHARLSRERSSLLV
jgi:hypothetical protein